MTLQPPDTEGETQGSLLRTLLRQLRWLVFGIPKGRHRGRWVYNSADKTWRYYVDDWSA